jgi:hypothetical protein
MTYRPFALSLKQGGDNKVEGIALQAASTNDTWAWAAMGDGGLYLTRATDASGADALADFSDTMTVNSTGNIGIGDTSPDTGEQPLKLDVEGAVGATYYCDQNGNNCKAITGLGRSGGITQVIQVVDTTNRNTTSTIFVDTGVEAAITPQSATSRVKVSVQGIVGRTIDGWVTFRLTRNGVDITPAGVNGHSEAVLHGMDAEDNFASTLSFEFVDNPGSVSPQIYRLQWKVNGDPGGTAYLGRRHADTKIDAPTYMTLEEISE